MTVELFNPGKKYTAPAGAHLSYRGGALLNSPKLFGVFVDDPSSGVPFSLASEMSSFLDFLATSDVLAELKEYNVSGSGSHIGDAFVSLFGSPVPTPPPNPGPPPPPPVPGPVPCPPGCQSVRHHRRHRHLLDIIKHKSGMISGKSVDDSDLQSLLAKEIASGGVARPDSETLYVMFLPDGVSVSMQGDSSCQVFCGYHNSFNLPDGSSVYYAVLPFPSCDGCLGGLSAEDALTATTSHEVCEAITDPVPGEGWYDDQNGEVGDICAWQFRQDGQFNIQLEWSNQKGACI